MENGCGKWEATAASRQGSIVAYSMRWVIAMGKVNVRDLLPESTELPATLHVSR